MKSLIRRSAWFLNVGMVLLLCACAGMTEDRVEYVPFIEEDPVISYYEYNGKLSEIYMTEEGNYRLWQDKCFVPYALEDEPIPTITAYLVESQTPVGCLIISPGGGYVRCNTEVSDVVAKHICETMGFSVFVVNYRTAPNNYKAMLSDELRAIRFIRFYADDFHVDPTHIAVLGMSAGGHLALMAGEHYDYGKTGDPIDAVSSKPDAIALCYPVVSMHSQYAHEISRANFLGMEDTEENRVRFSGELAIRDDMPPVFVIHSKNDNIVSIENSYALVSALEENDISCTSYWYDKGGHGYGIGDNAAGTEGWTERMHEWLEELDFPTAK